MIFRETPLPGAWVLEPERFADERGFFARTFCRRDFAARGLEPAVAQCSVSYNHRRGTVRGLHFQIAPHEEVKLVRVTRGALWDVIVDLRPGSPTLRKHFAIVLSADLGNQLYVPKGMAHGFQTLEDATEVSYQISEPYAPEAARGYRWDDPAFAIPWPEPATVISEKDRSLPFFSVDPSRPPAQGPHPPAPSPAPSQPPSPGEGERRRKASSGSSPSSPGEGGWEGAGEEGRGDEGLREES